MSTPQPPATPSSSVAGPVPLQEVARPKRRVLPWIIGGAVLLVLVAAALVTWFVVLPLVNGGSSDGPRETVLAYDEAYDEADCALYQSVTTTAFQEALAPTCADFEAAAQSFLESYEEYDVAVDEVDVAGDTATVTTTESWMLDGESSSQEYVYTLVRDGGSWRIDDLQ